VELRKLIELLEVDSRLTLTFDSHESQVQLLSVRSRATDLPLLSLHQLDSQVAIVETPAELHTTVENGRIRLHGMVSVNSLGDTIFAPAAGELNQLRQYVRISFELEATISRKSGVATDGCTVDISGGGVRIKFKRSVSFDPGVVVSIDLPIPSPNSTISVPAVCIDGNPDIGFRFQFTDLRPAVEDKICAFVVVEQQKQLRRRSGL
jgi:hypothetical protein